MYWSPDIEDIRIKMNDYGKAGRPFLFGVNFELTEGFFVDSPLLQSEIFYNMNGRGNDGFLPYISGDKYTMFDYQAVSYIEYKEKFNIVHAKLCEGYSYLTNLTIKTPVSFNLSLEDIFVKSNACYRLLCPGKFVCFSPERFVKIAGRRISTNPMKGTIDASIPNAEQIILNDFKETAEHNTIVDLLRNDLSIVADHVQLERFRYVDRIKTNKAEILQISSEIAGTLREGNYLNYGDIIFSMLPAGSVSGAPKDATVSIIKEAEKESRGYYTGVFGYFDGRELDSAVLIRYIEKVGDKHFFRSGGGIMAYSDSQSEYDEVIKKIYLPIQ